MWVRCSLNCSIFFKSGLLRVLAQNSVGANDSLLDSQLKRVEAAMTEIMKFNDSFIMTIPDIGH